MITAPWSLAGAGVTGQAPTYPLRRRDRRIGSIV